MTPQPEKSYSDVEIRTVAFLAAGAATAAVMRLAPTVVMPSEEIVDAVDAILDDAREGRLPR
ncbi:MAG TPA: hypothetical protein VG348_15825 [Acidimicrobiia bacterium]|jgi:hypothetical protein|nr:hypothetical protein [Acidimicrobiia bacterium]